MATRKPLEQITAQDLEAAAIRLNPRLADNYVHITSRFEDLLGQLEKRVGRLRWTTPRALCGASLMAASPEDDPGPDGPLCPGCAIIAYGHGQAGVR